MPVARSAIVSIAVAASAVAGVAAGPVLAEPRVRIADYGLYEVKRSGREVAAKRTLTGSVKIVSTMRLTRKTDKVLAQLGTNFGLRIDLLGFPSGPVTLTIRARHPRVTNPETGVTRAVSEYDWQVVGRRNLYFGYGIRKRWHINEGVWTVQVLYRGKVLAQKRFELIVPLN